jgi:hypothetical protein
MGVHTAIVRKGTHHFLGEILMYHSGFLLVVSPKPKKKFYFGLIAASLIENVRFCPASA